MANPEPELRSAFDPRMSILTRYLLRLHAVPFLFAFVALTGFMLLNQVARRIEFLLGKGLPWTVILEFFALTVPYLVAMTLSMSVLVAVLYAFSRMMDDREITALRAGGISLGRLVRPLLVAAVGVGAVSFLFSDQVLPRTNHRLRTLMTDIYRAKPAFSLKEHVVNEVQRGRYFLRAARIDQGSYWLYDVALYDLHESDRSRVIYADSGRLQFTSNQEDLQLSLYSGTIHESDRQDPGTFQDIEYARQTLMMRGIGREFVRRDSDEYRGDREMGTCDLHSVVQESRLDEEVARRQLVVVRRSMLRSLVGLNEMPPDTARVEPRPSVYCRAVEWLTGVVTPTELEAQQRPPAAGAAVGDSARARVMGARTPTNRSGEARVLLDRAQSARVRAAVYAVEFHKKWAIAVACVVFVLVGVPIAMRFPRGGVGLVVAASMIVFGIYYMGLIAGESLANKLIVGPAVAMWASNVLMASFGLLGLWRARRRGTVPARVLRRNAATRGGP
jgi:lipopolysaccharide export system permease protein